MSEPDWENFAKAVLTDWPTGDLDGEVLFDLSLQYGMIQEVAGGYNSDHHIDAYGISPEEGDPWYEYTFRGEAGRGLYSVTDMNKRIEDLEASKNEALNQLDSALYSVSVLEKRVNSLMGENADLKAKLAKAVKCLQSLIIEYDKVDLAYDEPKSMTAVYGLALDTLAELTGGSDE